MLHGLTTCIFLILADFTEVYGTQGSSNERNDIELQMIANWEVCGIFGGYCSDACVGNYTSVSHPWGIPLCRLERSCCKHRDLTRTAPPATAPPPIPTPTTPAPEYGTCGLGTISNIRRKRVVGGHLSLQGEWPWLVRMVRFDGLYFCAGAVIAQRWVLTAAHCFSFFSELAILYRVHVRRNSFTENGTGGSHHNLVIKRILKHPGYDRYNLRYNSDGSAVVASMNDIALLELAEDTKVEPICLPAMDEFPELEYPSASNCWVAGWGKTTDAAIDDDMKLRQVSGAITSREECSESWGGQLHEGSICFSDGTRGPCSGDSGTPVQCQYNGRFYLTGISSWGAESCNRSGLPYVFMNTRSYLPWIYGIMMEG